MLCKTAFSRLSKAMLRNMSEKLYDTFGVPVFLINCKSIAEKQFLQAIFWLKYALSTHI
jgi:hypothetical protein